MRAEQITVTRVRPVTVTVQQEITSPDGIVAVQTRHELRMETYTELETRYVEEPVEQPPPELLSDNDLEISSLADEIYQDAEVDNCLDYACTLLAQLEAEGVDLASMQVVIMKNEDPSEPGHVGLLDADGVFYDQSGAHDFAEYQAEHPELTVLTDSAGELPRGDVLLSAMKLPPGDERNAALQAAGLTSLANEPVAIAPLLILGVAALAALVLSGCSGDPEPRVFNTQSELDAALAANQSLAGATFNFYVTGNLNDRDLSGATFAAGSGASFINANLSGATFTTETRGLFHGADLTNATFRGSVVNAAFLYADLTGTNFGGATIQGGDFAFANNVDRATWPASITNSVFTGTPRGTEASLGPVQLNTSEIVNALGGPENVRALAASGRLLPALQSVLPAGSLDGLLPPAWRSAIWDQYFPVATDPFANQAKSRVFDAVDSRYGTYDRPAGGPTMSWLYSTEPAFRPYLDNALASLILSDQPAFLNEPFQDRASPYNFQWVTNSMRGASDVSSWLASAAPIGWNGQDYDVRDVVFPANVIADLDSTFGSPTFRALAADGLVSIRDLQAAGLTDHIGQIFAWNR